MRLGVLCPPKASRSSRGTPAAATVFDATSAADPRHAPILERLGKIVIDLTPARVGLMAVPSVNMEEALQHRNVNMVTCGGQASSDRVCMGRTHRDIDYVEVVSSIASRSAGPATRRNLDEYIHTTEKGILRFSGCRRAKAILNLNPAEPCINMQTTLLAKVEEPDIPGFTRAFDEISAVIRRYVPGYQTLVPPTLEGGRIVAMVRVTGLGDYLPAYAGTSTSSTAPRSRWPRVQATASASPLTRGSSAERPISDPTLRDGNHAVSHQITPAQIATYCAAADAAGVPIVEVGHGTPRAPLAPARRGGQRRCHPPRCRPRGAQDEQARYPRHPRIRDDRARPRARAGRWRGRRPRSVARDRG
jgi:acetaldehyde dehydrogenase (acetylating)